MTRRIPTFAQFQTSTKSRVGLASGSLWTPDLALRRCPKFMLSNTPISSLQSDAVPPYRMAISISLQFQTLLASHSRSLETWGRVASSGASEVVCQGEAETHFFFLTKTQQPTSSSIWYLRLICCHNILVGYDMHAFAKDDLYCSIGDCFCGECLKREFATHPGAAPLCCSRKPMAIDPQPTSARRSELQRTTPGSNACKTATNCGRYGTCALGGAWNVVSAAGAIQDFNSNTLTSNNDPQRQRTKAAQPLGRVQAP
ncbi:hypothetical protein DL98DRAFT_72953 [Cadophora sp. DSE1049]|nr:hypothetical protein DL98DRAFT_72953 [Cadophora sp. DSE1049]